MERRRYIEVAKKVTRFSAVGALVFGSSLFAAEKPVLADLEHKAVVINDIGCNLFDTTGNLVRADGSHLVENNNNGQLSCRSNVGASGLKEVIRYNPENMGNIPCQVQNRLTWDWEQKITPSGEAVLSCRLP